MTAADDLDLDDLRLVFAALGVVAGPPSWFVVDANGRLVINSHPTGWAARGSLTVFAEATRSPAFLATLESGAVAQLKSNDSCLLARTYASALLLRVVQGLDSVVQEHTRRIMAEIDADVGHTVALLRRGHPAILRELVLAELLDD